MPTVLVHLESSDEKNSYKTQEYKVDTGLILHDELERQGLSLPHGCLAGSCGSCRIHVLKGLEFLSPMGVIETDTVNSIKDLYPGKYVRLSCRSKVYGNIEITPIK